MLRLFFIVLGLFIFSYREVLSRTSWEDEFRVEAIGSGVSAATLDIFFNNVKENSKVIDLDRKQPEFRLSFPEYLEIVVPEYRIKEGRRLFFRYLRILERLEKKYGIPPQYLIAFWGMESNFGKNKGDFILGSSLLTLAKDNRRPLFFRSELIEALKMMDREGIDISNVKSSWAGAFGNFQFMPSTYNKYAVDYNKDNRVDIIEDIEDSFASAANYLFSAGWRRGEVWGRGVILPVDFPWLEIDISEKRPLREWKRLGVKNVNKQDLPDSDIISELVLPMGHKGPAFLVYNNFEVILDWNHSVYYGLAIGYFADRIVNRSFLSMNKYPSGEDFTHYEAKELQEGLCSLGFYKGDIEGIIGRESREAIKKFQRSINLPADGYADSIILGRIKEEKAKKDKSFACEK